MAAPTFETLRERIDYDPATGVLTWKDRPSDVLPRVATTKLRSGYLRVSIRHKGTNYDIRAHRLIWALTYNRWPVAEIDHINGDRSDNRLANLREATRAQNAQNIGADSPTRGTVFVPRLGKFQAQIYRGGKTIWLGHFATRDEARAKYLAAKAMLHPFQPVPRRAS